MGNKSGAKREERRKKQQNNVTEADSEKEDGAQARIESTTDSVGTKLPHMADCQGVQVSEKANISTSKSAGSNRNLEITTSPAAGAFPSYQTPVASKSSPTPQSIDMGVIQSFGDIGLVVHAMDNNVRGLLIKVLAESICSGTDIFYVIQTMIDHHAVVRGQENVAEDLKELEVFNDGTIPSDGMRLLHMLKKAFGRFIQLTECKSLDPEVVKKLKTESQPLHELCETDKIKIFSFLINSTVVKDHVIRVWIEEILHKAELTTSQFSYLLMDRQIHIIGFHNHEKKDWHLKHLVKHLLEIRVRIVHYEFKFFDDHDRKNFLELYEEFIEEIHLPTYFPLRDAKTELERYLQLEVTSKDFENIVNCYNDMVEQCRASEHERRKLEKEVSELTFLVLTYEGTIRFRDNEILRLKDRITSLILENTQPNRMADELKTKDR